MMSILDYSYTNARIRSLKSRLIDEGFFKALLACETLEEIVNTLSETNYGEDVNQAIFFKYGTRGVEEGLKKNLIKSVNFLKEKVLSKKALVLASPLLERWDIHNLKAILRGKHTGSPEAEIIDSFIPIGNLSMEILTELARATDLKEMIQMLYTIGSPYYLPLKRNLNDYLAEHNLQQYEVELDKYYFELALKQVSSPYFRFLDSLDQNRKITKNMLRVEIDIVNVITAVKLSPDYVETETVNKLFVPGGKLVSKSLFEELFSKRLLEEKIEVLKQTPFAEKIKKSFDEVTNTGFVSPLQRRLEEMLIEEAVSLFKAYPLSIAPVIAYIWAKYNEVVNLRIVLRCKEADIPNEKILNSLILVKS